MKRLYFITTILAAVAFASSALAISVGETAKDNSVEAQLEAFTVHPDFEINLFADESMGIANPIAMHWDERGRLWVLTTLTYAQLEPGKSPNDTLVILEDTDEDGSADKSTVFADGLNMPMGFALYQDGVFVGEGADLLYLKDEDGDSKADSREVVLTGFGTGDTHQNISNFTWGPDGCLYFSQGLHCYSRVETRSGIVRGDAAGFWRFNPRTLQLDPYCFPSLCSQNPCGIAFDKEGALFIKSNNRELIFATPGLIPTTHQKNLDPIGSIGATPGKSMGGEYVASDHLPEWIQNHILIAGYYSHRVSAFPLVKEDSGYAQVEPLEILSSTHSSFRPVEIRIGGDGAIYVADWFNPIIGHYQASLRHPDRDAEHGRIWRITAKGRELSRQLPLYHQLSVSDPDGGGVPFIQQGMEAMIEDPRTRLRAIVDTANRKEAAAMREIAKALDYPRDRFIDYALEQSVHALAPYWVPAIEGGTLSFEKSSHLAFALDTLGGVEALKIARGELRKLKPGDKSRYELLKVLAKNGTPKDLASVLRDPMIDPAVLAAMKEGWVERRVKPADGFESDLLQLMEAKEDPKFSSAMSLAGLWQVKSCSPGIREVLSDPGSDLISRKVAADALGRIEGKGSLALLQKLFEGAAPEEAFVYAEALAVVAPEVFAKGVVGQLSQQSSAANAGPLVAPLLSRKGGAELFLKALQASPPTKEVAMMMVQSMSEMGRSDEALLGFLQDTMGVSSGARAYSPAFVKELAKEVLAEGNAEIGGQIYHRAELTCAACHQLDNVGGLIGPSIDAVGAGLTTDLLIESVLWPQRQLKEGYFAVAVNTKGGDTFAGYREKDENGVYYLRDTASGEVKALQRVEISKIVNAGSLMPQGLTNSLTRDELRDLIAYLASLKG